MSGHATVYRQLKAHPEWLPRVRAMEAEASMRPVWYVPTARVAEAEAELRTGDVLGLATSQDGMDIAHTGLAYRDEAGVLRFLHASSAQEKVVLDKRLSECLGGRRIMGIVAARPVG
jgi:hypothetical protein